MLKPLETTPLGLPSATCGAECQKREWADSVGREDDTQYLSQRYNMVRKEKRDAYLSYLFFELHKYVFRTLVTPMDSLYVASAHKEGRPKNNV